MGQENDERGTNKTNVESALRCLEFPSQGSLCQQSVGGREGETPRAKSLLPRLVKNLKVCLRVHARNTAGQYNCNQEQLTQTRLLKKFTQLIANDATQLQSRVRAFRISCAVMEISYLFSKFNHGVRIELTVRYLAAGPLPGSTLYQLAS